MSKNSVEMNEALLIQEVLRDLQAEAQGMSPADGGMKQTNPVAYKATRELLLGIGKTAAIASISLRQAERLSALIHSKDEGLGSIQEVLDMQPINALTLMSLIRLERTWRARESANARHNRQGGSRDRRAELRAIFATGKYDTRTLCATEEHEALGVSFHTAMSYLRRTPDPRRC